MKTLLHFAYHSIFWLWNLAFLFVVYLGILPLVGIPLLLATLNGEVELEFFITLVGLIGVPTACTLIGLWRFPKQPLELMRLFYGVEAPLFLLCIVRLFVLRELTAASYFVLGTVLICVFAFLVEVLRGYLGNAEYRQGNVSMVAPTVQLIVHSLMLLVGLYAGALLLFYAIPVAAVLVEELLAFHWIDSFLWEWQYALLTVFWWIPFFAILFVGSSTLFVAMPSALASLYVHSGQRIVREFSRQYGRTRTMVISGSAIALWLSVFLVTQPQPQTQAFELLATSPQTDAQKQELLDRSPAIRKGLTNAYLSSYRYLGTWEESNQIRVMYRDVFGLPKPMLEGLQTGYNQLISPFLYRGKRGDEEKASKLYAQFFDTPLQKGERQAVRRALKSTAILDDAKAGVMNINQKKVWLEKQDITVQERGDWAEVELHEVYKNQTPDVEEIFYSFSLPESAAITGVWLGDTDNLKTRFPFTVSPRGAAQKVYNSQVSRPRPVDPALLEQVGPRQYRLRAFPVPPKRRSWERRNSLGRPTEMHLWLTYQVMREGDRWPLPVLTEKRNIFWTKKTQRWRNTEKVKGFGEDWLEASLPATAQPSSLHQATLDGYRLTAKPLTQKDYAIPEGKRFAIVLDSSRSMATHRQELVETFTWLQKNVLRRNNADLYVTGEKPRFVDEISNFKVKQKVFYGTLQLKEMLRQFAQLQGDLAYDGVLLVTDEGSYELSDDDKNVPKMSAPLWLVHLGGFPPAYADTTLKAIQDSGGGVSEQLSEVFQRLGTMAGSPSVVSVVDGYAWSLEKGTAQANSNSGIEPLAARMLVRGLSRETEGLAAEQLDAIHAIAKTNEIVTPYSSMIVLVNDQQREALKKAEAESDRFDREVEDGKEQLLKPNNPLNAATVPEPQMLIALAAIALFFVTQRRKVRV